MSSSVPSPIPMARVPEAFPEAVMVSLVVDGALAANNAGCAEEPLLTRSSYEPAIEPASALMEYAHLGIGTERTLGSPGLTTRRFAAGVSKTGPVQAPTLFMHQQKMINDTLKAVDEPGNPWLGIISPMQTGKSACIGPLIERLHSGYEAVIVLTFSSRATDQVHGDLEKHFGSGNIGRVDEAHKNISGITVASAWTREYLLENLDPTKKTLVILDEAYPHQCMTVRALLTHLGVAIEDPERPNRIRPSDNGGKLIGLSGTAAGLGREGHFRVVSRFDMLDAAEQGIIRLTDGKRIFPKEVTTEIRRGSQVSDTVKAGAAKSGSPVESSTPATELAKAVDSDAGHEEIWWKATPENALRLALAYQENIAGQYRKNLIFAPTIEHAILLEKALREICPDEVFALLHSDQSKTTQQTSLESFDNGGTLISVRMLTRSFRGLGCGAIFHTFQSTSEEYFAQSTGRGWANNADKSLPPLFVLEACWDKRPVFSNLARLYGLVDIPEGRITGAELLRRAREKRDVEDMEKELIENIRAGRVSRFFGKVPLAKPWRESFTDLLRVAASIHPGLDAAEALDLELDQAGRYGIIEKGFVSGFAQGALPIRYRHLQSLLYVIYKQLAAHMGEEAAIELAKRLENAWLHGWASAAADLQMGLRGRDAVPEDLKRWRAGPYQTWAATPATAGQAHSDSLRVAFSLNHILESHFGMPRDSYQPTPEHQAALARLEPHIVLLQKAWNIFKQWEMGGGEGSADETPRIIVRRGDIELRQNLRQPVRQAINAGRFRFTDDWFEAARFFMHYFSHAANHQMDPERRAVAAQEVQLIEAAVLNQHHWEPGVSAVELFRHLARRGFARFFASQSTYSPNSWGRLRNWQSQDDLVGFIYAPQNYVLTAAKLQTALRFLNSIADSDLPPQEICTGMALAAMDEISPWRNSLEAIPLSPAELALRTFVRGQLLRLARHDFPTDEKPLHGDSALQQAVTDWLIGKSAATIPIIETVAVTMMQHGAPPARLQELYQIWYAEHTGEAQSGWKLGRNDHGPGKGSYNELLAKLRAETLRRHPTFLSDPEDIKNLSPRFGTWIITGGCDPQNLAPLFDDIAATGKFWGIWTDHPKPGQPPGKRRLKMLMGVQNLAIQAVLELKAWLPNRSHKMSPREKARQQLVQECWGELPPGATLSGIGPEKVPLLLAWIRGQVATINASLIQSYLKP